MAIIVRHKTSERTFVLLGASHSAFWAAGVHRKNWLTNDGATPKNTYELVAVCDAQGNIRQIPQEEVQVISVDGRHVSEFFESKPAYR